MDFSSRGTLIVIGILLIIVIIGFFYWQDSGSEENVIGTQSEEDCLERYSQMSEDEFIEAIKDENIEFPFLEVSEIETRMAQVRSATGDYLVCKVGYDKSEDFYNKAKELIQGMKVQEQGKQNSLLALDEAFSESRGFILELALGDIDKICPDELPKLCLVTFPESSSDAEKEREKVITEQCNEMCDIIKKYIENTEENKDRIVNPNRGVGNPPKDESIRQNWIKYKVAIAYQVGGDALTLEFCDALTDSKDKDTCLLFLEELGSIDRDKICSDFRNKVNSTICSK